MVTNIQVAADARESDRRKEQEEACRLRYMRLNTLFVSIDNITKMFYTGRNKHYDNTPLKLYLCDICIHNKNHLILRRREILENEAKSSQEKFEEITRKWTDAKMKQTPLDLRDALNNQQQLCEQIAADKNKLISELQQVNTHTLQHATNASRNIDSKLRVFVCRS